jgi:hypothetical protein
MILVVPPGAEQYPISHGTTQYIPYRADHTDQKSIWLVEIQDRKSEIRDRRRRPWRLDQPSRAGCA